jgi:WD40 repeat protein
VLVSTSAAGHVALWDLETRALAAQMRNAHSAEVTGAKCLHGEPVLVTSSPDNTLKQVSAKHSSRTYHLT